MLNTLPVLCMTAMFYHHISTLVYIVYSEQHISMLTS